MYKLKSKRGQPEQAVFIPEFCSVQMLLPLILVAQLLVLSYVLLQSKLWLFDWQLFALMSLYVQWLVLLNAAMLCQLHKPLSTLPAVYAGFLSWLFIVLLVLAFSLLVQWLRPGLGLGSLDVQWILRDVLLAAIFSGIALRYRYLEALLKARQQAQYKADIQALQARIKPHFLFNSLNSISSLMHIDIDKAEAALDDLAQLFRASLASQEVLVSWYEELEVCEKYLAIERLRLEDRLQLDWQVELETRQVQVPLLTLQPVLENAIVHGVSRCVAGGCIAIRLWRQGNDVRLEVSNPVVSDSSERQNRSHLGDEPDAHALRNIQHRLAFIYGDTVRLSYGLDDNRQQFEFSLTYPLEPVHGA